MRAFAICLSLLCTAALCAPAQDNPVTSVVKEILPRQQKNLTAAAEEMPADKYSYKPTPEQISFGHLMTHISTSNTALCSAISGVAAPKQEELKETDGKDKLVAALKSSFDFCTSSLAKVDDSKLSDSVDLWGGRKGSRAFALIALSNDWADHYSAAAMYLRLNGMLPPTAQKK
jgi:uncharacterized damage-inducible protein DinB